MKSSIKLLAFLWFFNLNAIRAQQPAEINTQFFYDQLSPYGNWIVNPNYGYVWHPRVSVGFRPYLDGGYWVWSDQYQWIWVSQYAWGWAAFHYGRWFYDAIYGWLWVPGNQWSPAWVSWRSGSDYYGWAPLSPDINFGMNFSYYDYNPPFDYWIFVNSAFLTSSNLYHHCHPVSHNHDIIVHTNPRPTIHLVDLIVNGPAKNEVEIQTKEKLQSYNIRENDRPGINKIEKNNINVFKPKVEWKDKEFAKPQKEMQLKPELNKNLPEKNIQREPTINKTEPIKNIESKREPSPKEIPQNDPLLKTAPEKRKPPINKTEPIKNIEPKREPSPRQMPEKNIPIKRIPQNNAPIKIAPEKRELNRKP